jgi:hypothetical protein
MKGLLFTEEEQRAAMLKGRDPMEVPFGHKGLKPLTLVMKNKENMYFS